MYLDEFNSDQDKSIIYHNFGPKSDSKIADRNGYIRLHNALPMDVAYRYTEISPVDTHLIGRAQCMRRLSDARTYRAHV